MLKRDTFLHFQTPKRRSLGFSALMSPVPPGYTSFNLHGDMMVWVGITRCNSHDRNFCKKTARAVLREKQQEYVRVRDLPELFAKTARRCGLSAEEYGASEEDFAYILRKFV